MTETKRVRCAYQRCDLVSLSVVCVLHFNVPCALVGELDKYKCLEFKPES